MPPYPSPADIEGNAGGLNVDPFEVYGFAAVSGHLPNTPDEMGAFQRQVIDRYRQIDGIGTDAQWPNSKPYYYGFIQSLGRLPTIWAGDMAPYLRTIGAANASGVFVPGHAPRPGDGYPPGGAPTPIPVPRSGPGPTPRPDPRPVPVPNPVPGPTPRPGPDPVPAPDVQGKITLPLVVAGIVVFLVVVRK